MYRVWFDPLYDKRSSEAKYGKEYDAISPETAAYQFAEERYEDMQHVDPGMVLVRDLETNEVTRWSVAARVVFDVERKMPPPNESEGR